MEPALRASSSAAPRLRRAGAGALECAHRALPATGGAREFPDLPAIKCCAVFPFASTTGSASLAQAVGAFYPKKHVAASGCELANRGFHASAFFAGFAGYRSKRCPAHSDLHRKNWARAADGTAEKKR